LRLQTHMPRQAFVDIDGLTYNGRRLGDYTFTADLRDNGIYVPDISGVLGQARLSGAVSYLDAVLDADVKVRDLAYADVIPGFRNGTLRAAFALSGKGETGDAILSSLTGTARIIGGDGMAEG